MSDLIVNQLPDYLSVPKGEMGTEEMSQYIIPPRVKLIQPTTKGAYREKFSEGDMVLTPQMIKITGLEFDDNKKRALGYSSEVIFTPLFFFVEWCCWNPQEAKELPMIREQTFDPKHIIAAKAKDAKRRVEPCPEFPEKNIRFVEHLNFIVAFHGDGFNALPPAILSFSRSEHRSGTNFMTLLKMRNAPMYGCKFAMNVQFRENDQGVWYGIDVKNPGEAVGPFVTAEQFAVTKKTYTELKEAHEARQLRVDYADDDVLEGTATPVNPEM